MKKPLKKYRNTVEFQVSGNCALFSDVLTRSGGEKTTYPFPTYEAMKGILNSVYWKPTFIWIIDRIRIMNKIQTYREGTKLLKYDGKRNEKYDLAHYTYLEDVCYQVMAHFEWNMNRPELEADRNEDKHFLIAKRMIEHGGRRDIFLGTRDCQGYVEPCTFGEGEGYYDASGNMSYGIMYHGITYADEAILPEDKGLMTVRLWNPVMKDGIIDFVRPEKCDMKRHIREMSVKSFGEEADNFAGLGEFEEIVL